MQQGSSNKFSVKAACTWHIRCRRRSLSNPIPADKCCKFMISAMQLRRQPLFLDLRRAVALSLPAVRNAFAKEAASFSSFFSSSYPQRTHGGPLWLRNPRTGATRWNLKRTLHGSPGSCPAAFFFFFRRLSEELSEDSWKAETAARYE